MAPVVAHLAQAFRDPRKPEVTNPVALYVSASRAPAKASPPASPLTAIPRKEQGPKPYASRAWCAARPEPLRLTPAACASCGAPVVKRRRRYCDACIPAMRVAHANKVIAIAREALAQRSAQGTDPRKDPEVNLRRAVAISQGHRLNREWKRENRRDRRDEVWFRREIFVKLNAFSLSEIAEATGLSLAACSRFRSGNRMPHPRHWDGLLLLVSVGAAPN
jgi:hypothetical protein